MARIVCQFSCGAASAVATKLVLAQHGGAHEVVISNAFVAEEHPDNRRFLADCENWFGHQIHVVREQAHGASAREVFRRRRYMVGRLGAPCSKLLKREVLNATLRPDDVLVLGYTADEAGRLDDFIDANNARKVLAPLITRGLTKPDVLAMVERAGLRLPEMYRLGFHNANCVGCVKGGAGYWNKIRRVFPDDFEEMAQIQEQIGPGANFLRHRAGPLKGQRFSLRELPRDAGHYPSEPSIECGAACELIEPDLHGADEWP